MVCMSASGAIWSLCVGVLCSNRSCNGVFGVGRKWSTLVENDRVSIKDELNRSVVENMVM